MAWRGVLLKLPPAEELRSVFIYDPDTGVLVWLHQHGRQAAGSIAGCLKTAGNIIVGHYVGYNGTKYKTSRVIWKMLYDEEPPELDHIDMDKNNNALSNLRAVSRQQNSMNHVVRSHNKLGVKGVYFNKQGTYTAQIISYGVKHFLGNYHSVEDAQAAYAKASKELHGSFGRLG